MGANAPYYINNKVDDVDYIEAADLEAIEDGFNGVDADKADKLVPANVGNLATLDASGNLGDSGKAAPAGDIVGTSDTQTLTNKTIPGFVTETGTQTLTNKTIPGFVTETGTQTLTNKTVTALKETRIAVGASQIDLALANYFTRTATGNITFTVTNVPASGEAICFVLELINGGSYTITWWANLNWPDGTAPSLSSGKDVLVFYTHDGGAAWNGFHAGGGMS